MELRFFKYQTWNLNNNDLQGNIFQPENILNYIVREGVKNNINYLGGIFHVYLFTIFYFGANEVRAHARLRARADVVATKLGIILLSFFFFFLSFHVLFSQKGFA